MAARTAEYWIRQLGLTEHPEGGAFREVYRCDENIPAQALPERYEGARSMSTSIYFLLKGTEMSAFHRISSDETWHFYTGCAVRVMMINEEGQYWEVLVGPDIENGEVWQYTIPRQVWFAAQPVEPESYTLVGCTVAPGFDFKDFELAEAAQLAGAFPQHEQVIRKFCTQ